MSETHLASAPPAALRPNRSLGIVVTMCCLAQFMVVLDSTIVILALPRMQASLNLSTAQQQWVVSGYLIALGGLLMLAARAGDLFSRRRVFILGGVVFTLASLAGGLAVDQAVLLAARVVQGVAAAALAPTSLSLITVTHTDEKQRHGAMALWSIMGGLASAVGVVLGGILTSELSWRWVLFINIPLGIALLAVTFAGLAPSPRSTKRARLDLPGAFSVTFGMGALAYGLSEAASDGWGATSVIAGLVAAAVLLVGFVMIEASTPRPLIPLRLFRPGALQVGNLLMFFLGVTMTAALFFLSLYFQEALGYSALRSGLSMLPMTIILIAGGLASRKLMAMLGRRALLAAGGIITSGGLFWLAAVPSHADYLPDVLGPTLVAGLGTALMLPPVTLTATVGVSPEEAGVAAGLLNTSRQIGGAVGLAALVIVASTATSNAFHRSSSVAALVHGYHMAFIVNAAIMLAAAVMALALPSVSVRETADKLLEERKPASQA